MLITNPNNPLGTIYSEEAIKEMIAWCLDNRVHYIRCGPCGVLNKNSHSQTNSKLLFETQYPEKVLGVGGQLLEWRPQRLLASGRCRSRQAAATGGPACEGGAGLAPGPS